MQNHIVTAVFGGSRIVKTRAIFKYDQGMELQIKGLTLPDTFTVDFANESSPTSVSMTGQDGIVAIPDQFLLNGENVIAWIVLHDTENDSETVYTIIIPVKERAERTDIEPTPVQQQQIDSLVTAMNSAVETAEDYADEAERQADRAETAALDSAAKAEIATQAAETATEAVEMVTDAAYRAESSATAAATSAGAAEISATQAGLSANSAAVSASDAEQSAQTAQEAVESIDDSVTRAESAANTATNAAQTASTKASEANTSAGTAAQNATAATVKASEAAQSAAQAEASATAAQTAQTAAETAQTGAETAQTAAETAAASAEAQADRAEGYADRLTDFLPVDTASGSIASFSDGADGVEVKSLTVGIEPVQDLHGYDGPWPAGGGANKWDEQWEVGTIDAGTGQNVPSNLIIRSKNYIPITPSTAYYFKAPYGGQVFYYDADKAYISASGLSENAAFTTLSTAHYMRFRLASNYGTTYHNDIAINYPATVTTYSSYSNICPISGWTGAKVTDDPKYGGTIVWNQYATPYVRTAENNGVTFATDENGNTTVTGTATAQATGYPTMGTMQAIQGHKYLLTGCPSGGAEGKYRLFLSDGSGAFPAGNRLSDVGSGSIKQASATTTVSFTSLIINVYPAAGDVSLVFKPQIFDLTAMFGAGNEPATGDDFRALFTHDYYPYNAGEVTCVSAVNGDPYETYPLTFPSTVYGGTLTYEGDGVWTVTVDRAIVTFDGSEAISASNNNTFYVPVSGARVINAQNQTTDKSVICDRLKSETWSAHIYDRGNMCCFPSWGSGIAFRDDTITTANDWKTYFTNNPTQFSYALATPTTYTLTTEQVVNTILGQNNFFADSGDTSVTYRADIQLYINKMLAAALNA